MNINLIPIKFSNRVLLKNIAERLSLYFNSRIGLINDLNIDYGNAYYPERSQYYSTQIIADVIPLTSKLNGKVILLTEFDLFIPALTFVFGEAQLDGKHSIVSVCRLHEEFYTGETNDDLLLTRSLKEVLHELGHNYGLKHCMDWDCVMHSSPGIEEIDIKGKQFCKICAAKIEDYKQYIPSKL